MFKVNKRLSTLKKYGKTIHWELCKDIHKSIEYCTKEDTRVEGPWSIGTAPLDKK